MENCLNFVFFVVFFFFCFVLFFFQVIEKVEKLRSLLTQPSNLRVHVAADVNRLPDNPHVPWKTNLLLDTSAVIPKK